MAEQQDSTDVDKSPDLPTTAGIDRNLSLELHKALTADKDELFSVMQDGRGEVLRAALRNPALDDQHLLTLLKRRELDDLAAAIYASKRLMESYAVRFALVAHPETPAHLVSALLPQLYLFDLLKLCLMPGIAPDHKLAAERAIIRRIPTQPLGNKLTLSRRSPAAVVEALLCEGLPQVFEACLDNSHLKEGVVHQFLSSAQATAETISMIARHSRWKGRPNIRLAILKNPRTPNIWYTLFLPALPLHTVRELLSSSRLTMAQKELIRQTRRIT